MSDWNLDLPFDAEPTRIQTGDECEHSARGENCGRTDCTECGREAAATLRAVAPTSFPMLTWLASEVARLQDIYGSNVPDGAVVVGDVCAAMKASAGFPIKRLSSIGELAVAAWSEGLVDATCNAPMPKSERECFPVDGSIDHWDALHVRWCYVLGRSSLAVARLSAHLSRQSREPLWHERAAMDKQAAQAPVQRESPVPGKPWIYPDEFVPLSSAAGAPSAPPTTPTLPARTPADQGPGWKSRAQHR